MGFSYTSDCTASCSSSTSSRDSIFSSAESSCSSAHSSVRAASPDPLVSSTNDILKATTVHLPLYLPAPPGGFDSLEPVNWDALELDESLRDAPRDFVESNLNQLGPVMLHTAATTTLHLPPSADLPSSGFLRCSPSPVEGGPIPTHVLCIKSLDSERRLLVPVHGLRWATLCGGLGCLSRSVPMQVETDDDSLFLPVISLSLPSALAFPLLQSYLHLRNPQALLDALLPAPESKPASLSHLLNTPSEDLSHVATQTLLERVKLVHGLWGNAVALGVSEQGLWWAMQQAWGAVVGEMREREEKRRRVVLEEALRRMDV